MVQPNDEEFKPYDFRIADFIKIEVEDLRKLLKAENVYAKYNDFKRYILERTQKELKEKTDVRFDLDND